MLKGINGNIQRTNCINNGGHLFMGPSYICFNSETIKEDFANLNDWIYIYNISEQFWRLQKSIIKREIIIEIPIRELAITVNK